MALTKLHIELGNYGVPATIVTTRVFATKKNKFSTTLTLLNRVWRNLTAADVIILIAETGLSASSIDEIFLLKYIPGYHKHRATLHYWIDGFH